VALKDPLVAGPDDMPVLVNL